MNTISNNSMLVGLPGDMKNGNIFQAPADTFSADSYYLFSAPYEDRCKEMSHISLIYTSTYYIEKVIFIVGYSFSTYYLM